MQLDQYVVALVVILGDWQPFGVALGTCLGVLLGFMSTALCGGHGDRFGNRGFCAILCEDSNLSCQQFGDDSAVS